MNFRTYTLLLTTLCFASCKTYEVMHYKNAELDKVGDINNYTVYVHSKSGTYKVNKPSYAAGVLKGAPSKIEDQTELTEIKNPKTSHEIKKHKHDLNLYTQSEIKDSTVTLKKGEITEISHTVSHSTINLGDILTTVFGLALCIALLGVFVYWIVLAIG